MDEEKDLSIERLSGDPGYTDRDIYRKNISVKNKYCYKLKYKHTDLFITCDREISGDLKGPVLYFYNCIETIIKNDPEFGKSLVPVRARNDYPGFIKKMCEAAAMFNTGPMASVAGAVCDIIADSIAPNCKFLMIENGGDVYIKSDSIVKAGLFTGNPCFFDSLNIIINPEDTPCGICSSSGRIGHSLSLGKSDLVTIMSDTATIADAAATAVANSITVKYDIENSVEYFKGNKEIKGLIIIKDDRLGIFGSLQLN